MFEMNLLDVIRDNKDQDYQLYKEMKQEESSNQQELDVILTEMRISFPIGTLVDIKDTGYIGKVVDYNQRAFGLYSGNRYPLYIEIVKCSPTCKHKAIGRVFEYSHDQVFRLDYLEKALEDICSGNGQSTLPDNKEYMRCYNNLIN